MTNQGESRKRKKSAGEGHTPDWEEIARRTEDWRPDRDQLERLMEMNEELAATPPPAALCQPKPERLPMVFVTGTPRSGTTIMLQSLANSFEFTYPDNITARFWGALHHGVAVSRSLQHQLGLSWPRPFDNDIGTTRDLLGIHGIGHFWLRFFRFSEIDCFHGEGEKKPVNTGRLRDEMAAMFRAGLEHPLLFRGVYLCLVTDHLAEIFPDAFFIDMRRDLVDVCQSALAVRQRRYGDEAAWWSVKPPQYAFLREAEPEVQVAAQFHHVRVLADAALSRIPESRKISVDFSKFREAPRKVLMSVMADAIAAGVPLKRREGVDLPSSFNAAPSTFPEDRGRRNRLRDLLSFYEKNPDHMAPAGIDRDKHDD